MMEGQKPERIEEIKRRYPNEWLAILVTKLDKFGEPVEGILLLHTPNRKEVWEKIRGHKEEVFVFYAGDPVPPGMEVVLSGNLSVQPTSKFHSGERPTPWENNYLCHLSG